MNPRGTLPRLLSCEDLKTEHFFYYSDDRWSCDSCAEILSKELMNRILEREVDINSGIGIHIWPAQIEQVEDTK